MSLGEKLAERQFRSGRVQESWKVHTQAFGPILEPAFTHSYMARVHLVAALNLLNNQKVTKAQKKLAELEDFCRTDADRGAVAFCKGLACELTGDVRGMLNHYQQADAHEHGYYFIYLKVAKAAHNLEEYDTAIANYEKALACFPTEGVQHTLRSDVIRASIYTNLASCLTMQFRFGEAEKMLQKSKQISGEQTGRAATEAILYAAMGRRDKAERCLRELETQMPELVDVATRTVEEIFSGVHPHFKNTPKA